MAITKSDRLGITRWSADTDTVSRAQFDEDNGQLNNVVAMDMQGTLANRPAAAAANRGLYYFVTGDATAANNDRIWRSTGAAWVEVLTGPIASAAYIGKGAAKSAVVITGETTTSTTYADLATVGPSVTAEIGPSGRALIIVGAVISNNTAGQTSLMSFTGAGVAANDADSAYFNSSSANAEAHFSNVLMGVGLTKGLQTFTAKYRVAGGTGRFAVRRFQVIPL